MTTMITTNDICNQIAEALANHMQEGLMEMGMGDRKLFLRVGGQVFEISVEEKTQFRFVADRVKAAKNFMASLPMSFRIEH